MNFKRIGRCRNCKSLWQAPAGSWSAFIPQCRDCRGPLTRVEVPAADRADVIADHVARGKATARRPPQRRNQNRG